MEDSYFDNRFLSLESVTCGDNIKLDSDVIEYRIINLKQILSLFNLRPLKHLRISLPRISIAWPRSTPPKSWITSLILHHSQLSEENLGKLLAATFRLNVLKYHYLVPKTRSLDPGWNMLDCTKLELALGHVHDTLEDLEIYVNSTEIGFNSYSCGCKGVKGRIQSLATFHRLELCTLPIYMLLGPCYDAQIAIRDLLPTNIRELDLYNCELYSPDTMGVEEWFIQLVENYFEWSAVHGSKLESIIFQVKNHHKMDYATSSKVMKCNGCFVMFDIGRRTRHIWGNIQENEDNPSNQSAR